MKYTDTLFIIYKSQFYRNYFYNGNNFATRTKGTQNSKFDLKDVMHFTIFRRELIHIATLTEQFFPFINLNIIAIKSLFRKILVRFYTRLVYCQKIALHSHRNSTGRLRVILGVLNVKWKELQASSQFMYYPLAVPSVCNTTNYFIPYTNTSISVFISDTSSAAYMIWQFRLGKWF